MLPEFNIILFISEIASIMTALAAIMLGTKKFRKWFFRSIELKVDENTKEIKRQELLLLLYNNPKAAQIIEGTYDEYQGMGGNSYIDTMMKQWRLTYANDVVKEKLIK